MSNKEIGIRLKNVRTQKGYTLDEVANAVGVAKSTIQRYEAGKITSIKLPVIESISRFLQVNPAWVIGTSETPEIPSSFTIEVDKNAYTKYQQFLSRMSTYSRLLLEFENLNDIGKEKLNEQLNLLSKIPEYTNTRTSVETVSEHTDNTLSYATYKRTDIEVTNETKQQEDDIELIWKLTVKERGG